MKDLKILFMGTPEFAVNVLDKLIENFNVVGVVSQPDKFVGRKKILTNTPVKERALKDSISVFQPNNIKEEYDFLLKMDIDLIVTCAYGQFIPDIVLNYPKYASINVHASLLPELRGGAPIQRAIINGLEYTGITIMDMVSKMDAGDIYAQVKTKIEENDTYETLHDRLSIMGANLVVETIPKIVNNTITKIKQDENKVTFAKNIKREEEKLDFNDTTINIYNKIRGLSPNPATYFILDSEIKVYNSRIVYNNSNDEIGKIVNIYKDGFGIKTRDGEIVITDLKPFGKKRMLAKDYLNGIDKNKLIGKIVK